VDIAGERRGEKSHQMPNVVRLTKVSSGNVLLDELSLRLLRWMQFLNLSRIDAAGGDRVHSDAMRAKFGGQCSGPADESCLGGRSAVELWRHQRAGYVDDSTPVLSLHPRHDEISQSPCSEKIECKCLVPERIVRLACDRPRTTGVVDEDIDTPAKSRQGFSCDRSGAAFRTNIPDHDRRTTAGTRGQRSGHLLQRRCCAPADRHMHANVRKSQRDPAADT